MKIDSSKIELRCRKCNKYIMNYTLTGDDSAVVLQNIEIKCDRCKRIMRLMKYTEGVLRLQAKDGILKI